MEKVILREGKEERTLEVKDLWEADKIAKQQVKDSLASGNKNPKVYIYTTWVNGMKAMPAWVIISKKDIAEKKIMDVNLTELELYVLTKIVANYKNDGINNTDFYNVFAQEDTKAIRGALSNLVRKQIVNRENCPDCFNPIYPSTNFHTTCKKYGIEETQESLAY